MLYNNMDLRGYLGMKKLYQGRLLRYGYTTGSCAAAAAKGALKMLLEQKKYSEIEIKTPADIILKLNLTDCYFDRKHASCCVVKDGGDDPDVTHGAKIYAKVQLIVEAEIKLFGGKGVGYITKPGLAVPVGQPAINPVPRNMIISAVKELLPVNQGAEIVIEVPEGEIIAKKTLNSQLGILGGISILGTTGIVEPMSDEAFKTSLAQALKIVQAENKQIIAFTPGKIGQQFASGKYNINQDCILQTSNFIGFMLEEAQNHGIKEVLLFGHIGKLVKIAAGIFNTHNRIADARRETLAVHAALAGASLETISRLMDANTAEAGVEIIKEQGLEQVFSKIAEKASERAAAYCRHQLLVGTILLNLQGEVIGFDSKGLEIGGRIGWRMK